MLTKRIPDTVVTSEDLSHTTMTKICEKNYGKKQSDKNKYRYNCNCKISQNDKNILLQDMHYAIQYTTLSIKISNDKSSHKNQYLKINGKIKPDNQ